jgi:hypothetical protein
VNAAGQATYDPRQPAVVRGATIRVRAACKRCARERLAGALCRQRASHEAAVRRTTVATECPELEVEALDALVLEVVAAGIRMLASDLA